MTHSRSVRRTIRRAGLQMDVAADVNAVVSVGEPDAVTTSSSVQHVSVTQHRGQPVRDQSTRTEEEK